MPRASSIVLPAERPTSGAAAVYALPAPNSECSSAPYTRSNAPSSQSNPPQASPVETSSGSRIAWKSVRAALGPSAAPRTKIAAAGSRRNSSSAILVSGSCERKCARSSSSRAGAAGTRRGRFARRPRTGSRLAPRRGRSAQRPRGSTPAGPRRDGERRPSSRWCSPVGLDHLRRDRLRDGPRPMHRGPDTPGISAGRPGTSTRSGWRRPGRATGSARRSEGTAGRRDGTRG